MIPQPINVFGLFHIYVFGLFAAGSLLAAYLEMDRQFMRAGAEGRILPNLFIAIMIPALIGARFLYLFFHWPEYFSSLTSVTKAWRVWEGGLVLYGGFIAGAAGAYAYLNLKRIPFLKTADLIISGVALGFALSRLGCFAAGCCYGVPTTMPWGVIFYHPLTIAPTDIALHPTQLYSFFFGMLIFFTLCALRHRKSFHGEIFLVYLVLETASRIGIEFFRADTQPLILLTALFVFISSLLVFNFKKQNRGGYFIMNFKWTVAPLIIVMIFVSACGIVKTQKLERGHDIHKSDADQIVKGQTTEKEILKLFGPPTKWRETPEGKEFFYEYTKTGGPQWNLVFTVGGGSLTKTLLVWLDKTGVVTDYAYKAS